MNQEEQKELALAVLGKLIETIHSGELIPRTIRIENDIRDISSDGMVVDMLVIGQKYTFDFAISRSLLTK